MTTAVRRGRIASLLRPLAWLPLGVLLCSGCGTREHVAPVADYPIEREVDLAFQAADASLAVGSSATAAPATVAPAKTQLARFAARSDRPVRMTLGGFTQPAGSGVQLVQTSGGQRPAAPASGAQRMELIPTPGAERDVDSEEIPTPRGEREPVARIAAEPDPAKSDVAAKSASIEANAAGRRAAAQPDLIDPNSDAGLVDSSNGPEDFQNWPAPEAVLFVTGDQHGYIEPCGCTGLENQKGGVARRYTFMKQLRDKGWKVIPVDAGNQIRRIGQQASIKFEKSAKALSEMKYQSVGFGPGDMRLSAGELIATTYADSPESAMFVSANIVLLDPELLPTYKTVEQGEWKIGLTSILDPEALDAPVEEDVTIGPIKAAAEKVVSEMTSAGTNFRVLTFFGAEDDAKKLMADVPGFDLIVVAGGYGEPTYRPQSIEGSLTKMIVTGNKGMYVGLVGLYQDRELKYARVPLTHEYKDAPEMRQLMAEYQQQLEQLGLGGLGISPIPHPSGNKFVGTQACAECHKSAFEVWETSAHADATKHIVEPTEGRGDIPRHFDPECLSCHVTGWNPQKYYPYESGYLGLKKTPHLTGNGCENCHGPGSAHVAAEAKDSGADEALKKRLRMEMQLPLEKAKEHCMKCHDLDNSPDFHNDNAFEDEYWPQVEHYGTD